MGLTTALIVLFAGFGFIGLAGISYRFRAFTNKPAWNGATKPLLFIGIPLLIIGLALTYFAYRAAFGVN